MVRKQPKIHNETDRQLLFRNCWLVVFVCVHLAACYFLPLCSSEANFRNLLLLPIVGLMVGALLSQIPIFGFLMAMFPGPILLRLSLVIGFTAVSISALLFGDRHFPGVRVNLLSYLSWIPVLVAGCTVPFIVARAFLGWTVGFQGQHEMQEFRLTVSGMLVGTAMFACCLMFVQTGDPTRVADALMWSITAAGFGFLVGVPICLWLLNESCIRWAILKLVGVSFGPTLLLSMGFFRGSLGLEGMFGMIAVCGFLASFGSFLICLRLSGLHFLTRLASPPISRSRSTGERGA